MEFLKTVMSIVYSYFRIDITLFGFTFTFWHIFLFTCVIGIIGFIIHYLLS